VCGDKRATEKKRRKEPMDTIFKKREGKKNKEEKKLTAL